MYPSTVAKLEAGERSVRIDEAAAIASIFGVSIDSLMGRRVGIENDLVYSLRGALSSAKQAATQVAAIQAGLSERLLEDLLTIEFEGRERAEADAVAALNALDQAVSALNTLAGFRLPSTAVIQLRINRTLDAAFERVLNDVKLISKDSAKVRVSNNTRKRGQKPHDS